MYVLPQDLLAESSTTSFADQRSESSSTLVPLCFHSACAEMEERSPIEFGYVELRMHCAHLSAQRYATEAAVDAARSQLQEAQRDAAGVVSVAPAAPASATSDDTSPTHESDAATSSDHGDETLRKVCFLKDMMTEYLTILMLLLYEYYSRLRIERRFDFAARRRKQRRQSSSLSPRSKPHARLCHPYQHREGSCACHLRVRFACSPVRSSDHPRSHDELRRPSSSSSRRRSVHERSSSRVVAFFSHYTGLRHRLAGGHVAS